MIKACKRCIGKTFIWSMKSPGPSSNGLSAPHMGRNREEFQHQQVQEDRHFSSVHVTNWCNLTGSFLFVLFHRKCS